MFSKQDDESSSSAGFTKVEGNNTHSVKNNSTYNLLGTLAREEHPLVAPFDLLKPQNTISNSESEAYLLKFTTQSYLKLVCKFGV